LEHQTEERIHYGNRVSTGEKEEEKETRHDNFMGEE